MKKLFKWFWIILKKHPDGNDFIDAWLIPCYWKSIHDIATVYKDRDREFFLEHTVKQWKHDLWRWWMHIALYRTSSRIYTFKSIKRYSWPIYLNASPSIKQKK
jgi:hypothetical protein